MWIERLILVVTLGVSMGCESKEGGESDWSDRSDWSENEGGDTGAHSLSFDSGDASSGDSGDVEVDEDCSDDSDCMPWEICEAGECEDGDRSDSFSEAESIAAGDEVSAYINREGDKDYWSYTSAGGEFVRSAVWYETDPPEAQERDTFATLYNPVGEVVTSSDDYPNGNRVANHDSVIYAYLAEPGNYTFEIEDANARSGGVAWGGAEYSYRFSVNGLDTNTAGESSLSDPFLLAEDGLSGILMDTNAWYAVGALLEEPGQVDYVAVDFGSDLTGGLLVVDGLEDLRGSDATPLVMVLDPDEAVVSSKSDVGPDGPALAPALREGQWILSLADADGGGGSNHWFFVLLLAESDEDNLGWEVEPNELYDAAMPLDMTEAFNSSGKPFSFGSVQGYINEPEDTDWFYMSAPEDASGENSDGEPVQWVVVCANSHLWGSSASPTVRVYDGEGSVLGESETDIEDDPNLRIENIEITPGEAVFIEVTSGSDAMGAPDEWYRLRAYISSFPVSSYEDGGYKCL